ncbi:PREDICTED: kinesin-like protein KIN-7C, mitochondrial [Nelumbo nucifera]|uniref:Kinesin-like protein KIN-7C, mitochondrial n=1 Tax=Nelumbo nucifera TaxID=4432 RepID=A0A1U8B0D8_NELNU|nr:PREDICTED: kinesin-like protein KIN-7C, mitochondrial [Nelumbo nucifera]XP_010268984.1 PREDICTED: kinesin-like protein KIN-7C, mitochondrial [Nelumbo nucifera]
MSGTSSRSQRSSSSVSPFRSRKSPAVPPAVPSVAKSGGRPTTPSSSRPPPKLSVSPATSINSTTTLDRSDFTKAKENVTVTVRFRPLSAREINKGDEIAWYADGDYTVRNEYNSSVAYGFDRVFGPATTTRHVYDVAAQHVVSGAMQGINGTVFAYGVTSSGKTHTMHGEQKSPGIIPLAVKDVFGIIQETPGREFLLRVSYLEIYNEVINDLLDPTGQNLRIREDAQGTYVEGIKEEVVLSPAHALSLIASGEEHRHVGSNNFNLLSSRSHTIFTLTIESSPHGENQGEEDVTLSQLNLIDLAGSESSKTETTGLRRKEGSYINKSLLTLGTVISKLTDGKATHIPYRDSKLTRLLQSSLSGHGRISLICTVTPASSNSEETHNTLKFAHKCKHVEIKASQNKIMDEKSLIKKYQREISSLKQELQQLKRGMMENPYLVSSNQEDLLNLKLQLEAGQVKLQSRLEEEEQAKAALMGRIQRLTKLILVSTKNTISSSIPEKAGHRRRHSFGEDELAYLPDRKREYMIDEDAGSLDSEFSAEGRCDASNLDELVKDDRKNRKRGMLGWFKLKKPEHLNGLSPIVDSESSASGSPASSRPLQHKIQLGDMKEGRRKSVSRRGDDHPIIDSFPERTQAGDLFSATVRGRRLPPTGTTITDQMDLLREQVKMLAGEVALCTSSLKRLSEQAASNPEDTNIREHMQKLKDEISEKKLQMRVLEQRMLGSIETTPNTSNSIEMFQALSKLASQLNEKTFELEIKSADNRILQEQLQMKISENSEMQETILLLRQQLNSLADGSSSHPKQIADNEATMLRNCSDEPLQENGGLKDKVGTYEESFLDGSTPTSVMNLNGIFSEEDSRGCKSDTSLNSQVLMQAAEIENLKQEKVRLTEEKDGLEIQSRKLAEEASYAKELAAAAAVELRNLAEEVTKLSYENAKLTGDLAAAKETQCRSHACHRHTSFDCKQDHIGVARPDACPRKTEDVALVEKLQKELSARCQREASLEAALSERDHIEEELHKKLNEAKKREEELENELANMWVLVAKMKKNNISSVEASLEGAHIPDVSPRIINGFPSSNGHTSKMSKIDDNYASMDELSTLEEVRACYEKERRRCKELENVISRLKSENLVGLDITALEELQNLHVEAITKICHAKCSSHIL